jgi:hypothetical protein
MPPTKPKSPKPTDTHQEEPLTETNPAGPAEGVEQHSGPPEGHSTPIGTDTTAPTAAEVVSPTEQAPDPEAGTPGTPADDLDPVVYLEEYLLTHHPDERRAGEHPATTAIRLLTRLGAHGAHVTRCSAPYCNLPAHHGGEHGWVHVEPGR